MKLPTAGKSVTWVIWAIIIVLVGMYAIRRVIKLIDDLKARQAENDLATQINPSALTYEVSQYKIFADEIFAAMDGLGTDNATILNVFKKMDTNSDVLQLIKSFGTRSASYSGGIANLGSFSGNLASQLSNELSAGEKDQINAALDAKGITIKF